MPKNEAGQGCAKGGAVRTAGPGSHAAMPEQKLTKGAYLLAEAVYDSGNKEVRLVDVQRLAGTGNSWLATMPTLATELRML